MARRAAGGGVRRAAVRAGRESGGRMTYTAVNALLTGGEADMSARDEPPRCPSPSASLFHLGRIVPVRRRRGGPSGDPPDAGRDRPGKIQTHYSRAAGMACAFDFQD